MRGFLQGIEPEVLPLTPANDPTVAAMAWGGVIVAIVAFPTVVRLWRIFVGSLTHHTGKLPAAERTLGDRLSQVAGLLLCCLMWGILLYCVAYRLRGGDLALTPGAGVGLTAAAALVAFLIQIVGYNLVGYAFLTAADTQSWTRALTVSISMMGYWMMLPALGALLFPTAVFRLVWIGVAFFIWFRIALWIKCFRIFYDGPFSIVYFFLYLCTLETVPLLIPVGIALYIC
ncbi:MAG: DUF4271 domain-containing protein [Muribaculaceae bacterium]|nr:DUF4271 domain-containing protein [Muribaculaceae bacterium]